MNRITSLAFAVLAAAALAACGEAPAAVPTGAIDANASQVTYGMNLKITENGVLKADLTADTAVTPNGDTRTQMKKVKLVFINPGQAPSNLTSKTGEYDQPSGIMVARGDVVLLTPGEKGMRTIKSEELHWDQKGDRVWSEKPTSINEEGRTLYTDGFTSNSRFTTIQGKNARTSAVRVGEGGIRF